LRDGKVAEQGSHEDLLRIDGGVYRHLWEAQLTENTQVHEPEEVEQSVMMVNKGDAK
jgi:ATP-binding cassette subfamily B (MDR/TAP) protein 7